jgi:hypothetical protein
MQDIRNLSGEVKLNAAKWNSNSDAARRHDMVDCERGDQLRFWPERSVNTTRSTMTGGGLVLSRSLDWVRHNHPV